MGWLYCEYSKQSLIDRLTCTWECDDYTVRTLKHCVRYEDDRCLLWRVSELTFKKASYFFGREVSDTARVISCYILDSDPNDKGFNSWGYKSEAESSGTFYLSCPLSYLKLANEGIDKRWRAEVKAYHQAKKKR